MTNDNVSNATKVTTLPQAYHQSAFCTLLIVTKWHNLGSVQVVW